MSERGTFGRVSFAVVILVFLAVGCTPMVGPDYVKPPEAPQEKEWIQEEDPRLKNEEMDFSEWWTLFEDPVLDNLIQSAYRQNLPLQIAGVRILEARANLGIAVGNMYPQQQSVGADLRYNKISENAANTNSAFMDMMYWDTSIGFDVAWEVDVWGKFRRSVQFGIGTVEATIANYDDILVSVTAEVARTYILIRVFEWRLEIAHRNVEIQQRSLQIAEARFEAGAVTELDVAQAKSLLHDTEALIPSLQIGLRQTKNALAILLGLVPSEIDEILGEPRPLPTIKPEVAVGIPAELLRRRPDIRFAERQLAAQSPLIGVARADLFPHFGLFGSVGLVSSNASITAGGGGPALFGGGGGSTLGNVFQLNRSFAVAGAGPVVKWDIFNYGRLKNKVRVEDARFQQLVVNYQNTVLQAAQEVEDSMVAFLRSQEQLKALEQSVAASKRSVDLSLIQYREGLVSYQRVIDTQRFLTVQQDRLADVAGSVGTSLVATYKALGGGWQIRVGNDFVPEAIKAEMRERTDWGKLLEPKATVPPATAEEYQEAKGVVWWQDEEPSLQVDPPGTVLDQRNQWRWPDW
jgi:NodT family efflux transporter outer membrane factor (OMF) lipoprotein